MEDFLASPPVSPDRRLDTFEILALDLETTGTDPSRHEILSIGCTVLREGQLWMRENRHMLVRPRGAVPESSAVVHGLLDDHLQAAPPLEEVMPELLALLRGRVLLAHYARLEIGFLDRVCLELYGAPLIVPLIDTVRIERERLGSGGRPVRGRDLRLGTVRDRYNLPRYRAHDALVDAIAAGELLLAQLAYRRDTAVPRLEDIDTRI